jgi:hypothetical protein
MFGRKSKATTSFQLDESRKKSINKILDSKKDIGSRLRNLKSIIGNNSTNSKYKFN